MVFLINRKQLKFSWILTQRNLSWTLTVLLLTTFISVSHSRSFPQSRTYAALETAYAEVQLKEIKKLVDKAEDLLSRTPMTEPDKELPFYAQPEESKRNSYGFPVTGERRGAWGKDHICDLVCGHCMGVASRRVASLCSSECLWEGHNYKACMTYYSLSAK